jgi:hypothetical protein
LLSVGKLDAICHGSYFGHAKWKLIKGSLIVARGSKQGYLYMTKTKLCNDVLTVAKNDTMAELWHKRLGDMSEKGMQDLDRIEFLPELKGITLKPCEHCFVGKQHRVAFHTRPPHRAENVLVIVHTDVCSMTEKYLGEAFILCDIH